MSDTIFALATPPGRSAIAVVRVSGPESAAALKSLAGALPAPRRASVRRLRDPAGDVFDQAVTLWMPGPRSFTGEDSFELHLHGGAATVSAATDALNRLGLRPARPGEFSRRAFQAGNLSLTQAEAIADLIDAESEAQRRQALDQLGGALDRRHARWRESLVRILALLEAQIDFPDEDLPETSRQVGMLIQGLLDELGEVEGDARGRRVRDGFRIALIGAPNAGKSSLLNALAGRDAAIVTAIAGTTRDIIEVPMFVGGFKVLLADTAGLRETDDPIESEGVRRAEAWAAAADLRLLVLDLSGCEPAQVPEQLAAGDLIVLSKADLPSQSGAEDIRGKLDVVRASTTEAGGVDALRSWLEKALADRLSGADFPAVTRDRHRRAVNEARRSLLDALLAVDVGAELAAEDVRQAAKALRSVAGEVGVETVLSEVFGSFCIGK